MIFFNPVRRKTFIGYVELPRGTIVRSGSESFSMAEAAR